MNKREKWIAAGAAALLAAGVAAVGVSSYSSPWRELDRAKAALASRDAARLEQALDWQSVRDQNIRRMAGAALATSGLTSSDERATELVLGIQNEVDKMLTPAKLIESLGAKKFSDDKLVVRGGYLSVGTYVFAIEDPASKGAISLRMRRLGPMSWRIDDATVLDTSSLRPAAQASQAIPSTAPAADGPSGSEPAKSEAIELH